MDPARPFTVGTHNLHDSAGTVTLFADVIVFTEAVPRRIRHKVRATLERSIARARGRRVMVCRGQRDLVVVFRRRRFTLAGKPSYAKYVDGVAKVTPNRGTYTVPLRIRGTDRVVFVNAEHRINAAFPSQPDRGEREFRSDAWRRHTGGTLHTMARQAKAAVTVSAGDTNTPRNVRAYPQYNEAGHGYDRIGSSARLTDPQVLSRKGSDHHRLRATVHP